MAEVVIGQRGILPCFTDIHRHPPAVGKKFRPAMIALNCAFLFIGRNCRTDGKARWYPATACQCDEISVKITAITCPSVTCVDSVSPAPPGARFIVSHPAEHVLIKRFGPFEIVLFSGRRLRGECLECLI